MLQPILEYQKKDKELVDIEREIADSKAKKVVNQMVGIVRNAQQKIVSIEKNASTLIAEFNELVANYEKQSKQVESFTKQKLESISAEQLAEYEKQINDVNTNLLLLEKNISKLSKSISTELKEFEKTKNEVVEAKKRHAQGMSAYNALLESKKAQMDKLKSELEVLSKKAEPKLLAKYKKMRADKTFPVFVPLLGNSCGGCSMELPLSQINKLEETGLLECENCHRIIYKK